MFDFRHNRRAGLLLALISLCVQAKCSEPTGVPSGSGREEVDVEIPVFKGLDAEDLEEELKEGPKLILENNAIGKYHARIFSLITNSQTIYYWQKKGDVPILLGPSPFGELAASRMLERTRKGSIIQFYRPEFGFHGMYLENEKIIYDKKLLWVVIGASKLTLDYDTLIDCRKIEPLVVLGDFDRNAKFRWKQVSGERCKIFNRDWTWAYFCPKKTGLYVFEVSAEYKIWGDDGAVSEAKKRFSVTVNVKTTENQEISDLGVRNIASDSTQPVPPESTQGMATRSSDEKEKETLKGPKD